MDMVADQILHHVQPVELEARVHRVHALRRQLHRRDQRTAKRVGEFQQGAESGCSDAGETTTGKFNYQFCTRSAIWNP